MLARWLHLSSGAVHTEWRHQVTDDDVPQADRTLSNTAAYRPHASQTPTDHFHTQSPAAVCDKIISSLKQTSKTNLLQN